MKIMKVKMALLKNRVFVIAILVSAGWHIFWMSAVKVVMAPKDASAVKFSKISFLGPILGKGALEVRFETGERSLLERKFLDIISKDFYGPEEPGEEIDIEKRVSSKSASHMPGDEKLASFIEDSLGAAKAEPDYLIE